MGAPVQILPSRLEKAREGVRAPVRLFAADGRLRRYLKDFVHRSNLVVTPLRGWIVCDGLGPEAFSRK